MTRPRALAHLVAPLLLVLLAPALALAHRVNVYAYAEQGMILGEGYFSSGNKAMSSPVDILDAEGRLVAQTATDETGRFSLAVPEGRPPFKVVLKAGEGHQATFTLDLQNAQNAPTQAPLSEQAAPANAGGQSTSAGPIPNLSGQELELLVGKAVEDRIAPLSRQIARLAERQEGVSLKDVVGGVGWILGLFGAAVLFRR